MSELEHYRETCDASAAVRLGSTTHFIVASDEDYVLRVYDHAAPGRPTATHDLKAHLGPANPKEEPDIEGAARIGDRIYWITSHGCDKDGVKQESRERFFATDVTVANGTVRIDPVGTPYKHLLKDLGKAPDLRRFNLAEAATRKPEAEGGLNIEGLAPAADGSLLIGFRNPIPNDLALVVRLRNPAALVERPGTSADLTLAALLDLEGRGIRAIEFVPERNTYLLIGGAFNDDRKFQLLRWSGRSRQKPVAIPTDVLAKLNPEELIVVPGSGGTFVIRVLSDDGDALVGDKKCKKLKGTPDKQSFRAASFELAL